MYNNTMPMYCSIIYAPSIGLGVIAEDSKIKLKMAALYRS